MERNNAIKKALKGTKDYHETMISILKTFSVQKPQKSANFDEITALYDGRYTNSVWDNNSEIRYGETITYIRFKTGDKNLKVCWQCSIVAQDFISEYICATIHILSYYNVPYVCDCCGRHYTDDIPF